MMGDGNASRERGRLALLIRKCLQGFAKGPGEPAGTLQHCIQREECHDIISPGVDERSPVLIYNVSCLLSEFRKLSRELLMPLRALFCLCINDFPHFITICLKESIVRAGSLRGEMKRLALFIEHAVEVL